jgi:hypothetical protein
MESPKWLGNNFLLGSASLAISNMSINGCAEQQVALGAPSLVPMEVPPFAIRDQG